MNNTDKLKPCPLCGGEAKYDVTSSTEYNGHDHQDHEVACHSCNAWVICTVGNSEFDAFACSCCHDVKQAVFLKWNTRANESEIAELTKQIEELKASEWISVEDRLPEDGCPVAVRLESMNGRIEYSTCVYIGFFPFKSICWESGVSKEPVTHWVSLPKEPKE